MATDSVPLPIADDESPVLNPGQTPALIAKACRAAFSGSIGTINFHASPTDHDHQPLRNPPPPLPPHLHIQVQGIFSIWIPNLSSNSELSDDHIDIAKLSSDNTLWISRDNPWYRYGVILPGYYFPPAAYHTMYGFLMVAQIAAVTSSKKQRAMLPFMTEEKERIKSMLSRCVAENRYPDTAYLEDAHDNMSLTRAIFQLSLSLGDNICFDGKKAILYNIDVNVGAQTVKFHLLMEGEEPAYPTKDFADIIGPSRGYDLEASYEHKTLDEKASKRKELKEEQSGAKEPEAEPEDIVEQFEKVDLAADEAKTDGHNVL